MTAPTPARVQPTFLVPLLLISLMSGCNTFQMKKSGARYQGIGIELASESAESYHSVRQAKAQNSVVLHVVGDEQPFRILPLPPEGRSVFVSNLLRDTGVLKRLGGVDVALYRPSPHAIDGLRMDVQLASDKQSVRPECDYALQPGDRLRVAKAELDTVQTLLNMTLKRE